MLYAQRMSTIMAEVIAPEIKNIGIGRGVIRSLATKWNAEFVRRATKTIHLIEKDLTQRLRSASLLMEEVNIGPKGPVKARQAKELWRKEKLPGIWP